MGESSEGLEIANVDIADHTTNLSQRLRGWNDQLLMMGRFILNITQIEQEWDIALRVATHN